MLQIHSDDYIWFLDRVEASRVQPQLYLIADDVDLKRVPGLPGAPQNEAGLTRKFETSHVGAFQTHPR